MNITWNGALLASSTIRRHAARSLCGVILLGATQGCERESAEDLRAPSRDVGASAPPPGEAMVVTSDLSAGLARDPRGPGSPLPESEQVIAEGRRLYQWFNCTGCHGLQGGGGIGPPFADRQWIYGREPGNIFQSIVQGRPDGMPSFRMLESEEVWKLVAYVRSLGPGGENGLTRDHTGEAGQGGTGAGKERDR